jgi:NAD(P)H dehydrogenase (quinone)
MAKILVVYHSLSGNTKAMAEAVADGAREVAGAEVAVKPGL